MAKNQTAKQQTENTDVADSSKTDELVTGEFADGVAAPAVVADTPTIDPKAFANAGAATVAAISIPDTVKARVLVDGAYGRANDVVEVPVVEAEASGELDAHPEAVAYALSIGEVAE
jgi:hypothetical protein